MEKIKKYVENFFKSTKRNIRYSITLAECSEVVDEVRRGETSGVFVVSKLFDFGYAKGFRAAMAEIKKGGAA